MEDVILHFLDGEHRAPTTNIQMKPFAPMFLSLHFSKTKIS